MTDDPKPVAAGAPVVETPPDPERWTYTPGTFEARCSCPAHPDASMRRFGTLARCSECGEAVELCGATLGFKECVREKGHAPTLHTSKSGSSWGAAPSPGTTPATPASPGDAPHPAKCSACGDTYEDQPHGQHCGASAPRETGTTPASRDARASVALDGETHCVESPGPGDFAARLDALQNAVHDWETAPKRGESQADRSAVITAARAALESWVAAALRERDWLRVELDGQVNRSLILFGAKNRERDRADAAESRAEEARAALRVAERRLAEVERLLSLNGFTPDEDSDAPTCRECGDTYRLRDGAGASPECDPCAQALLADLRRALAASPGADDGHNATKKEG